MHRLVCALAGAATLLAAAPASSAIVTSLPAWATAEPIPHVAVDGYFGSGPQTFGDGITWTAAPAAWFGVAAPNHFGFGGNGDWFDDDALAATDQAPYLTMQFAFTAPVAAFLAQVNWYEVTPSSSITAYDAAGHVLDTIQLALNSTNLATPNGYYGFRESTASIARIVFSGPYVGARRISILSTAPTPAPEPDAWALLVLGLLGTGVVLRRCRSRLCAILSGGRYERLFEG